MRRIVLLSMISLGLLYSPDSEAEEHPELPWPTSVDWKPWDAALKEAKASKKPICLVIYTKWCPRCRELAPVFADKEIAKLIPKFVMVRQDRDAGPAWLKAFEATGDYIPRIVFIDSSGKVQTKIQSGNARFPYFYTGSRAPLLVASMKEALGE